MNALRSVVFNFLYIFGSLFLSIVLLWALLLPVRQCTAIISAVYGGYILFIARWVMGLKLEVRGVENLPATPCIIAAKHQSAFETLTIPFMAQWKYPVIILKKELTYLPLWGFYPRRMGLVPIDRGQGMESMRAMSAGCKQALDSGRNVAIFPQGTRVAPGIKKPYKAGLAKLYKDLDVQIVPMALNAGNFWGRNAFFKKSGTIVFEFLPPIPAGMPPLQMMDVLEQRLEAASDALLSSPSPSGRGSG
jgi:1-acyl-sn-glycerol-3-phosphate acyltransferase